MVSTYSPNINLEEPARGDQVGTWDTPVNNNMNVIDLCIGGLTTISLNNSPVTLSAAQFQCNLIVFNSTLTGSVAITFPTSFVKSYKIANNCTGSSAFTVTLRTSGGTNVICAPPGDIVEVINVGTQGLAYMNLDRIGSFWDYAGSSVPAWVSGCTVPPYINCDGTTFSSATYPQLATLLGTTTLPDARGRFRATLNQGTGRITTANGGMNANVNFQGSVGTITLQTSMLPAYTPSGSVSAPTVTIQAAQGYVTGGSFQALVPNGLGNIASQVLTTTTPAFTGGAQGGVSSPITPVPPAYTGGLTFIRSA